MIDGFYLQKKDFIDLKKQNKPITTTDPLVLKEILKNNPTTKKDILKAIEKYNDDNKLDINNRVMYSIQIGNVHITAVRTYFVGDLIYTIGWNMDGYPRFNFNNEGKMESAITAMTTHIYQEKDIYDINISGFIKEKLEDILISPQNNIKSESELNKILKELISDMNSLIGAGMYRSAIVKFNTVFKSNKLNNQDYQHKGETYDYYIKSYVLYISIIKEILDNYNDSTRNKNTPFDKFYFYDTEELMKNAIENNIVDPAHPRMKIKSDNAFTKDEMIKFDKILNEV